MSPTMISSLPFPLIARIRDDLARTGPAALTDLVMILPQDDGGIRAIYNRATPQALPPGWQAQPLDQLTDQDILTHQGLILAWSGLDACFPSFIPYGPDFYNLRWLFVDLGQTRLGMATSYHLGQRIWERYKTNPETRPPRDPLWGQARVIQLALPYLMLAKEGNGLREDLKGLMGVIIPDLDALFNFKKRHQVRWLIFSKLHKEKEALSWKTYRPPSGSWVVGMPELTTFGFLPQLNPSHKRFLSLRPLMRAAQWGDPLRKTVERLARYAWFRWTRTHEKAWRRRAYALAAEVRAYEDDPSTLVALRPSNKFKDFLKSGDAWCYQRSPIIFQGGSKDGCPIKGVWELKKEAAAPKGFSGMVISLPLLRRDLGVEEADRWIDWRKVLLRAGRKHTLARLLWLFARELLPSLPSTEWEGLKAADALDDAMDQLFIAYYFYNLLDPWRWRQGRYPFFIQRLQETVWEGLKGILERESKQQKPIQHYTAGLLAWYGYGDCPSGEEVPCHLQALITHFHHFLKAPQDEEDSKLTPQRREIADRFIALARYLLDPTALQFPKLPAKIPQNTPGLYRHLELLLTKEPFFWHLSPFFQDILTRYHDLRTRWQRQRMALQEKGQLDREALRTLLEDYDRLQGSSFALRHEMDILAWLLQRDRAQIENLLEATQGRPVIHIQVLNPWVIRGRDERVTLRVINVGTDTAYDFRIKRITFSEPAQVLEPMTPPADLPRQGRREGQWRVRAQGDQLRITLVYAYQDEREVPHEETLVIELPVRGRRAKLPRIIANPYRAGTPVGGADLFVGREELLHAIFSRLLSGNTQPILLRGPRRMGKTSILRQVQWLMEARERLEALGLQRSQIADIQRQVVVFTSLQELPLEQANQVSAFFLHILGQIHQQARIPELWAPGQKRMSPFPAVAFRETLERWIHTFIQAPVIILLDEWDELYREAYQDLARNLRVIIEYRQLEHVNWIISSTWVMVREVAQFGSPFYNQTFNLEVGPLTWDAARRLVIEPSDRVGVDWQGEAVVAALQQTGLRPYLLQLVCSKALDQLMRDPRAHQEGVITVDILRRALGEILQDAQYSDQYFGFLWDREPGMPPREDQVDAVGRLILWVLTEHYPHPLTRTEILDSIESTFRERNFDPLPMDFLQDRFQPQMELLHPIFDAITREGDKYTLSIPLIHAWLQERLASYGDREELILHLYRDVWKAYQLAHTQPGEKGP